MQKKKIYSCVKHLKTFWEKNISYRLLTLPVVLERFHHYLFYFRFLFLFFDLTGSGFVLKRAEAACHSLLD